MRVIGVLGGALLYAVSGATFFEDGEYKNKQVLFVRLNCFPQ